MVDSIKSVIGHRVRDYSLCLGNAGTQHTPGILSIVTVDLTEAQNPQGITFHDLTAIPNDCFKNLLLG
jgi:hypothetical protein